MTDISLKSAHNPDQGDMVIQADGEVIGVETLAEVPANMMPLGFAAHPTKKGQLVMIYVKKVCP